MTRILMLFSLMLFGCASTPQHLSEENLNEIKNVAIVSLVPEKVNFDKIGMISFLGEHAEFDMRGKITSSILSVSGARIAKSHPRWVVNSVKYDQADLLAKLQTAMGLNADLARQAFADLARKNNLDAIFVVRAAPDEENNLREGVNVLLTNDFMNNSQGLAIRMNLSVGVVNQKGRVIAQGGVPANLDDVKTIDPDTFDLRDRMKDNLRPEVVDKLGIVVLADLTGRLNLCFDALGF